MHGEEWSHISSSWSAHSPGRRGWRAPRCNSLHIPASSPVLCAPSPPPAMSSTPARLAPDLPPRSGLRSVCPRTLPIVRAGSCGGCVMCAASPWRNISFALPLPASLPSLPGDDVSASWTFGLRMLRKEHVRYTSFWIRKTRPLKHTSP
jgi:hypothetical protein